MVKARVEAQMNAKTVMTAIMAGSLSLLALSSGIAVSSAFGAEGSGVTVDYGAVPQAGETRRAPTRGSGKEVVLPLIFPDGTMADPWPLGGGSLVAGPVTLKPPSPETEPTPKAETEAEPAPVVEPASLTAATDESGPQPRPNPFRAGETAPEPETKTAMLEPAAAPPRTASPPSAALSLAFADGEVAIGDSERAALDALASELADSHERIALMGIASAEGASPGDARRLGLKRALTVRAYLVEKGIAETRIDVRSGKPEAQGRVDVLRGSKPAP
jgi:outer membrane protein OmpA-like peptidoglycan-associated protein